MLLLRDVLKKMPRGNIREHAARFFARAEDDIQEEMLDYIEARVYILTTIAILY